jgi:hypothetical protein
MRYAAYFAPAYDSPWWQSGSAWLGRCAVSGRALKQPPVPGLDPLQQQRLTAAPRRYGWHATLRAPFALAPGIDLDTLRGQLRRIAGAQRPFTLPALKVTLLDGFLALQPGAAGGSPGNEARAAIDAVASACVRGLQQLAAPLAEEEVQRRRAGGLTAEEDALMLRWGYPYVLERFHFHLSLTGLLRDAAPVAAAALHEAAVRWFAPLPPCRFDSIALFAEPAPGADFVLLEHVALGAGDPDGFAAGTAPSALYCAGIAFVSPGK